MRNAKVLIIPKLIIHSFYDLKGSLAMFPNVTIYLSLNFCMFSLGYRPSVNSQRALVALRFPRGYRPTASLFLQKSAAKHLFQRDSRQRL